ncbi:MAG: HEAT repeat domain-containing protein [Elusimicrobiota bacterium]|nr:MAG: HEAT repeat domain-containing protein [Elusimicrobiota bacterium]
MKAPAAAEPKTRRAPEEMPEPTKFQRRIELDAWLDAPPAGPGRAKAPASEVAARSTAAPESLGRPFALPGRASPEAPAGRYEADAGTGAERRDPVPELLRALKRADPRARARAADELGRFGGASEPAVTALVAALRDKSPRVRSSAGLALGNIGASRAGVVPLLIKALKDGSEDVRFAAALALSRIGTDEAREAFRSHVGDEARAAIDRPKVKSR